MEWPLTKDRLNCTLTWLKTLQMTHACAAVLNIEFNYKAPMNMSLKIFSENNPTLILSTDRTEDETTINGYLKWCFNNGINRHDNVTPTSLKDVLYDRHQY